METSHTRRDFLKTSGLTVAAATVIPSVLGKGGGVEKPNLVIVFPDQMRGQALGFLGEDPVVTPNLDAFAKECLFLPKAVSNWPVCSPFRAMLMTGKYPQSNKVLGNCTNVRGVELQKSDRCWSDVLKDKGYSLGYIGKWHLDKPHEPYINCANNRGKTKWNEWCPPDRRHSFDFWYSYGTYDYHMKPMYWKTDAKRNEFHYANEWGPKHEAELAIKYINNEGGTYRQNNKPFALVVSMNPPHTPYTQFPKKYLKAYEGKTDKDLLVRPNVDKSGKSKMSKLALKQTRNYFANITGVDDQFGRILKAIDAKGLKNNTIVLFTSDHGNCIGTHNQATKNNEFEESMRIPFLIRWPGKIQPRRDDLLMSVPDIYPTLLELMGFKADIPAKVEGTSRADIFLGKNGPRPTSQLYLKVLSPKTPELGKRGIRTHRYKLVITRMPNTPEKVVLYDLKNDPYELKNIASSKPEVVKQLIAKELNPRLEQTKDPWVRN